MCLKHPNTYQRIESYKLDQEISEALNSPQENFSSHFSLPFTLLVILILYGFVY